MHKVSYFKIICFTIVLSKVLTCFLLVKNQKLNRSEGHSAVKFLNDCTRRLQHRMAGRLDADGAVRGIDAQGSGIKGESPGWFRTVQTGQNFNRKVVDTL